MSINPQDKKIMISFIDAVRTLKKENPRLDADARYVACYLGVNPDVPNYKLANDFANILES